MMIESEFVQVMTLDPTYIRLGNDLAPNNLKVFSDTSFLKLLPYNPKCFSFIKFGPQGFGGNHYHSRIESFIAFGGELELVFLEQVVLTQYKYEKEKADKEKADSLKTIQLSTKDQIKLVTVFANVPHAVVNRSTNQDALLLEWADKPMDDVFDVSVTQLP